MFLHFVYIPYMWLCKFLAVANNIYNQSFRCLHPSDGNNNNIRYTNNELMIYTEYKLWWDHKIQHWYRSQISLHLMNVQLNIYILWEYLALAAWLFYISINVVIAAHQAGRQLSKPRPWCVLYSTFGHPTIDLVHSFVITKIMELLTCNWMRDCIDLREPGYFP